jgi:hypothetical protein
MRIPRLARRPLIAVLAASLLLLAACSSANKPARPGGVFGTPPTVSALTQGSIAECVIHRGLLPVSVLNNQHNFARWYRNGRVYVNVAFGTWWSMNQGVVVRGRQLSAWALLTAQQQKLPAQLCGSTAIPSPRPSA